MQLLVAPTSCGEPRLRWTDPHRSIGRDEEAALIFWEADLIALVRERRLLPHEDPPDWPAWVVFGTSRRGNPKMRYPRSTGVESRYWLRPNGHWQRL